MFCISCNCIFCGKTSVIAKQTVTHKESDHVLFIPRHCDFCGKTPVNAKRTVTHKESDHVLFIPRHCDFCGKTSVFAKQIVTIKNLIMYYLYHVIATFVEKHNSGWEQTEPHGIIKIRAY